MNNEAYDGRKILINQEANPCGKVCVPLNSEYCFLANSQEPVIESYSELIQKIDDPYIVTGIAQVACRLLVEVQNTTLELDESQETANFWKTVAENLTRDNLTGLLTGKGLDAILEELYTPESLKMLKEKNYYARIIYADINDLRMHNSGPGGHKQGDMAIATVGQAINKFLRSGRRQNTPTINDSDRRNSPNVPRTIAARSNEKGDEFFIMTLQSKQNIKSLHETKLTLESVLDNLYYTYNESNYKVSATFGISEVKFPRTREELSSIASIIDTAMMQHKLLAKNNNSSLGTIVEIDT